ncbi:MAG: hypothetical protein AUJ02_09350 [Chloroflexi bacterium 13_1_40CM_3_65_12]|nr:MAG: hypothetical protein AUJ02_09350 [Chloroflexi bacterium 13_1_40CM_3_65_12]
MGTVSLLVKLVSGLTTAQEQALLTAYGGTERTSISALHLYVVDVPAAQATAIGARYLADRRVKSVELDHVRKTAASPSDPLYSSQWNLPQIGWDHVYGSVTPTGTATIAILDTGVDASHPDLAGRVLPGYSAFAGSDPLTDPNGHGTEMAGITVAVTDNQTGVAGVAYSGVSIIPVQVLDSAGVGQDSDIVNGVIWAADNRASVILMPFSNSGFSQNLQDAISYAWSKGAVLVAATGNDGSPNATYPAGDADVVGVSATDPTDALWSGSNYGVDTFIAAPGVNIPTTNPGGTYTTISGTSASSAMVAGVAAFERAVDPAASNAVIVGRLAHDADPAGTAGQTGNGRVNMQRVVADTSSISATPVGVPGGGPLLGPYTVAALHDGDGSMTVTPTTAVAGSTGNSFTFTFTAGAGGGNMNGGAVAMTVPIGWTTPQTTNSANPGFISTATGTCDVVSTAITGTGPWTVTFTVGNCSNYRWSLPVHDADQSQRRHLDQHPAAPANDHGQRGRGQQAGLHDLGFELHGDLESDRGPDHGPEPGQLRQPVQPLEHRDGGPDQQQPGQPQVLAHLGREHGHLGQHPEQWQQRQLLLRRHQSRYPDHHRG